MKTTKKILGELQSTLITNYENMLKDLSMKKSVRECLVDGYRQGTVAAIHHTVTMLGVEVEE